MPQAYIKKVAAAAKDSVSNVEDLWKKATDAAGQGNADNYGLITHIFKKMIAKKYGKSVVESANEASTEVTHSISMSKNCEPDFKKMMALLSNLTRQGHGTKVTVDVDGDDKTDFYFDGDGGDYFGFEDDEALAEIYFKKAEDGTVNALGQTHNPQVSKPAGQKVRPHTCPECGYIDASASKICPECGVAKESPND